MPRVIIYHLVNTNISSVNELSGTMDLDSTMIRAEALFRRYQRAVEAIDKKDNFPGPKPASSDAATSASAKGKSTEVVSKVITPELRKLLSRKVEVLPRKTVAQNGDGMPGK